MGSSVQVKCSDSNIEGREIPPAMEGSTEGQMLAGIEGQMTVGNQGQIPTGNQDQMTVGNQGKQFTGNEGQMTVGNQDQLPVVTNGCMQKGNEGQILTGNEHQMTAGNNANHPGNGPEGDQQLPPAAMLPGGMDETDCDEKYLNFDIFLHNEGLFFITFKHTLGA